MMRALLLSVLAWAAVAGEAEAPGLYLPLYNHEQPAKPAVQPDAPLLERLRAWEPDQRWYAGWTEDPLPSPLIRDADLDALLALLPDDGPSGRKEGDRPRPLGELALQAIGYLVGCDPRPLLGRDVDAPWTAAERAATTAALAAWRGRRPGDIATNLAARLPGETLALWRRYWTAEQLGTAVAVLVQAWSDGPPAGLDVAELSERMAAVGDRPELAAVFAAWPQDGSVGLAVACWRQAHGDGAHLDRLTAAACAAMGRDPAASDALAAILPCLVEFHQPARLALLQRLLAKPEHPAWERLGVAALGYDDAGAAFIRALPQDQWPSQEGRQAMLLTVLQARLADPRSAAATLAWLKRNSYRLDPPAEFAADPPGDPAALAAMIGRCREWLTATLAKSVPAVGQSLAQCRAAEIRPITAEEVEESGPNDEMDREEIVALVRTAQQHGFPRDPDLVGRIRARAAALPPLSADELERYPSADERTAYLLDQACQNEAERLQLLATGELRSTFWLIVHGHGALEDAPLLAAPSPRPARGLEFALVSTPGHRAGNARGMLVFWFLDELRKITDPAHRVRLLDGMQALLLPDDAAHLANLARLRAIAAIPTAPALDAPLADRLASWPCIRADQRDACLRRMNAVPEQTADLSPAEQIRMRQLHHEIRLIGPADLDGLFALLDDTAPSRWIDHQGTTIARTRGDNALRAIIDILGFDPRPLAGRDPGAAWTDAERRATATALRQWWASHRGQDPAAIRLANLTQLAPSAAIATVQAMPAATRGPAVQLLATRWAHGPPAVSERDLVTLLRWTATHPGLAAVVARWPVAGAAELPLAVWWLKRGDDSHVARGLEQAQHPPAWNKDSRQRLGICLAIACTQPTPEHLRLLEASCAAPPEDPRYQAVLFHILTAEAPSALAPLLDDARNRFEIPPENRNFILPLWAACRLLEDRRPLPAGFLTCERGYFSAGLDDGYLGRINPPATDLRACDFAGFWFLEHQPTWLHLQLRDQPLATLDLSQPLAAREALLDQLRGLLIPLCGAALRAVRLPDAVPGDRSGAGMAGANGF